VRVWADIHFINPDKKAEALAVADEMEKWRIAKKEAHTAKWRLAKKAASKL
jgi:hypothetical protein